MCGDTGKKGIGCTPNSWAWSFSLSMTTGPNIILYPWNQRRWVERPLETPLPDPLTEDTERSREDKRS